MHNTISIQYCENNIENNSTLIISDLTKIYFCQNGVEPKKYIFPQSIGLNKDKRHRYNMNSSDNYEKHFESQNVTDYPNTNTIFCVWVFKKDADIQPAFEQVCAVVANLNHSFAVRMPEDRVSCVMGIGYEAWIKLNLPTPVPKELTNFRPIVGEKYTAVSTPGDIHFHFRAANISACIDMSVAIAAVLNTVADRVEEVHGFRYWDGRSILGFVDGTENPIGKQRARFGMVGKEDLQYEGGSYLFVQKYVHNMEAWNSLSDEQQEKVFGRYKISDIEMPENIKPGNSHSALAGITDAQGNDLKIVRDNMPFRNAAKNEFGTYFISYANTFSTTNEMLKCMYIGNPPGNYDRILDFSIAQTGTLFFAPSVDLLNAYKAK
ncbi:putative iron-dependent peroxidase [Chitinophaga sp. W2I13]